MIVRPQIKAKYHVEPVPGDGVYLLSEMDKHVLEGPGLIEIVPLLDGRRTWDDILAEVEGTVGRDEALAAFEVLKAYGHVEEGGGLLPPELAIFFAELGKDAAAAHRLIAETSIHIEALGRVDPEPMAEAMRGFGFALAPAEDAPLTIVVTDDYQSQGIAEVNARCLAQGTPWILVKPVGLLPLVGPFFRPGRTACWACLDARLGHNREVESYLQRKQGRAEPFPVARARLPLAESQAVSLAAHQLVRWLAMGVNPSLESAIVSLDILRAEQSTHWVMRRPQCPACGDPELGRIGGKPVVLESRTLPAPVENGLRAESAEATFARYAYHVSPISGIVQSLTPSPWHSTTPIRTYIAGHNFALKNDELYFLKDGLRSSSAGKGRTDSQARTSALCEALERFSGLHRGEEPRRLATMAELGDEAVDPRSFMLYSDRQYEERDEWMRKPGRFNAVPLRFEPETPIHWSPLWSWTERRRKYLPTSCLYYGFQDPEPERFFCWPDSNGNAAGSCLEDAVLQGFFELVERDAVALWWYNRVRRPAVDLTALGEPYIAEYQAFFDSIGRDLWVLDITSDLGIPACAAISRRRSGPKEDIVMGFGAHLDPSVAVSRALTELNQFMPAVLSVNQAGETQYAYGDAACLEWWNMATLENQPYLEPDGVRALPTGADVGPKADVRAQILDCFGRVEAKGMEVLILDQTRPDVGLPVVKVVVPGLRHFWARFGPGRLYDVPVEMGWLKSPLREDELNPVPMFI
jgi:ribosomal protein S12 methylthiotransferase accessory factor